MSNERSIETELKIIDGQLLGCLLYIVSLIISIIVIYNQRKKALNQNTFITDQESQTIALANKILILLLIVWFLYLNYESYQYTKSLNQDTSAIELQIVASILAVAGGLIGLYVVSTNFQNTSFQIAESENPEL
ncbi:MAG: hypothetical protein PUB18_05875 [bacterium]|nr:hypothetical protein [bacterium]